MIEILPDEKIIPITHVVKKGIVQLPMTDIKIETLLIPDDIEEHYEHLTQHMLDEASVTLTAYHMYENNSLIFDLEVGGKNFRYIFNVTHEHFNILQKSNLLVIINAKNNSPIFMADISGCQSSMGQLLAMILMTEASKIANKNNDG